MWRGLDTRRVGIRVQERGGRVGKAGGGRRWRKRRNTDRKIVARKMFLVVFDAVIYYSLTLYHRVSVWMQVLADDSYTEVTTIENLVVN